MVIYKAGELDAQRAFDKACGDILVFCAAMRAKYRRRSTESWRQMATEEELQRFNDLQTIREIAEIQIDQYRSHNKNFYPKKFVRRNMLASEMV